MEEYFDDRNAVVTLRFDVLNIVHGRRHRALADGHETFFHFLGSDAGVTPDHAHYWNVDVRKNIRRYARDCYGPDQDNENRHHREGVGPSKRKANDPHAN